MYTLYTSYIYIYIYIYNIQGYYLNFLVYINFNFLRWKNPWFCYILLSSIVIKYCNLDLFLNAVASNAFEGALFWKYCPLNRKEPAEATKISHLFTAYQSLSVPFLPHLIKEVSAIEKYFQWQKNMRQFQWVCTSKQRNIFFIC